MSVQLPMQVQPIRQDQLEELVRESRMFSGGGKVADTIPELAKSSADVLGATIYTLQGETISAGDCKEPFTLQSISKVFSLLVALQDRGERNVFRKVGMEPTGEDYNSMLKLELIQPGTPFNPMINAGAIAVSSMIDGTTPEARADKVLELVRRLGGDSEHQIDYNMQVYESERDTAFRNRSLAWFLKDNGVIEGDVDEHLDVYFRHCSIEVNCSLLARISAVLANDGKDPHSGEQLVDARYVQIVKTFMVTCGMYNASGEFAIKVGIPAKSGVSGGIAAIVPGRMGVGVIGPALDIKGNSVSGLHLLRRLSELYKWSMF